MTSPAAPSGQPTVTAPWQTDGCAPCSGEREAAREEPQPWDSLPSPRPPHPAPPVRDKSLHKNCHFLIKLGFGLRKVSAFREKAVPRFLLCSCSQPTAELPRGRCNSFKCRRIPVLLLKKKNHIIHRALETLRRLLADN